jgi:hypothetical protein
MRITYFYESSKEIMELDIHLNQDKDSMKIKILQLNNFVPYKGIKKIYQLF